MSKGSWPVGWPADQLDALMALALAEDAVSSDVTSEAVVEPELRAKAVLLAKETGVIAGLPVVARVFASMDPDLRWVALVSDGVHVTTVPTRLGTVEGTVRSILRAERVALNFLQHLSGVATLTWQAVSQAPGVEVLDTRKTTPGLRWLERYAVRTGGGRNHRFGLGDGVLIKDNHVRAAGGIRSAVLRAKERAPFGLRIEVECTTLAEVSEALDAGAEIILLDNMPTALLTQAVQLIGHRARTEASGGINLQSIAEVARTGVTSVSMGSLTHSARALDLSLEIEEMG